MTHVGTGKTNCFTDKDGRRTNTTPFLQTRNVTSSSVSATQPKLSWHQWTGIMPSQTQGSAWSGAIWPGELHSLCTSPAARSIRQQLLIHRQPLPAPLTAAGLTNTLSQWQRDDGHGRKAEITTLGLKLVNWQLEQPREGCKMYFQS